MVRVTVAPARGCGEVRLDDVLTCIRSSSATVSVTVICADRCPGAEAVTVASYLPGARPAASAVSVSVLDVVPEAGVAWSHGASSPIENVVAPPLELRLTCAE